MLQILAEAWNSYGDSSGGGGGNNWGDGGGGKASGKGGDMWNNTWDGGANSWDGGLGAMGNMGGMDGMGLDGMMGGGKGKGGGWGPAGMGKGGGSGPYGGGNPGQSGPGVEHMLQALLELLGAVDNWEGGGQGQAQNKVIDGAVYDVHGNAHKIDPQAAAQQVPGADATEVEAFIAEHTSLNPKAANMLRLLDPKLQTVVMKKGPMHDARDPSAVLIARCSKISKMTEGDWVCPNCLDHQFAKNAFCRMCQHPKPAVPVI
eukprot:TRINITY_DN28829_c0_g2_i1.p1 TRINITY_DN28829_c0_g2~~TRINITY_DN28829_c0_g2_i1.p1  ORF type:complete len:280 (-),score=58.12 TRINITY_DN28829_c0_g2_i1:196-975(-)